MFRKTRKTLESLKSEFIEVNDSLDFLKKITIIISALIITSTIILVIGKET